MFADVWLYNSAGQPLIWATVQWPPAAVVTCEGITFAWNTVHQRYEQVVVPVIPRASSTPPAK